MKNKVLTVVVALVLGLSGCATLPEQQKNPRIQFIETPEGVAAVVDSEILFPVNSAKLYQQTDEMFEVLKPVVDRARNKIRVEGHTDSTGKAALNQKLSQQRAESVRAAMIEKIKIAPNRLEAVGYGASRPAIPNAKNADELAKNRRAVIFFPGETKESLQTEKVESALSKFANKANEWASAIGEKIVDIFK